MAMSCKLDARAFLAATQCIASGDSRKSLNGVLIEPRQDGALLVGCNGHTMVVILDRIAEWSEEDRAPRVLRLQREGIAAIKKHCMGAGPVTLHISKEDGNTDWWGAAIRVFPGELVPRATDESFLDPDLPDNIHWRGFVQVIKESYPNWRNAVPVCRPIHAPASAFDPRLIGKIAQAAAYLSGRRERCPIVVFGSAKAEEAALVTLNDEDAFGLLMPMTRVSAGNPFVKTKVGYEVPVWAGIPKPEAPPAPQKPKPRKGEKQ